MHNPSDIIDLDAPETYEESPPESVIQNDDGSKTITLLYPFKATLRSNNKEIEEDYNSIRLRRVNTGDLVAITKFKDEMEQSIVLMSRLSGLPKVILEKVDADDFAVLTEVIGGFLERARKIGKA